MTSVLNVMPRFWRNTNLNAVLTANLGQRERKSQINLQGVTMEKILADHASERTKPIVYSRVMGYTVPVERFNIGKQGEHQERKFFKEDRD